MKMVDIIKLMYNVFSTPQGKELLDEWQEVFVKGKLYHESDRTTVYAIAQRDFVLEILDVVNNGERNGT